MRTGARSRIGYGLAVIFFSACAHHEDTLLRRKEPDPLRVATPSPPSPPYLPLRSPVLPPKLAGAKATPASNLADRPISIAGRVVQYQDKTASIIESRFVPSGSVEFISKWRSEFPVRAIATYGGTHETCFAAEDGRVGCVRATNTHGMQVEWLSQEPEVRSMAILRTSDNWVLCLVRKDGSPRCDVLASSWPVETGEKVVFKSSTPSVEAVRMAAKLAESFSQMGKLRKVFAEPRCGIDEAGTFKCLDDRGNPKVFLENVLEATPECALMRDHTVRCWGANQYGQVGVGHRSRSVPDPSPVVGLRDVERIATSGVNACAIRKGGELFCWGTQFGPDFSLAAAKVPLCMLQDRPPAREPDPCPSVPRGGDDLCGRIQYNARVAGSEGPIILRDADGQCAGPGEDYVPTPTKVTVVDGAVDVEPNHQGLRVVRRDGVIVEIANTFLREIEVRASPTRP